MGKCNIHILGKNKTTTPTTTNNNVPQMHRINGDILVPIRKKPVIKGHILKPGMVAHASNLSTLEAGRGGSQ